VVDLVFRPDTKRHNQLSESQIGIREFLVLRDEPA